MIRDLDKESKRVSVEFEKAYGTTDHPLHAELLRGLETRGLANVLADIGEAAVNRPEIPRADDRETIDL